VADEDGVSDTRLDRVDITKVNACGKKQGK
jgi:hypothetical protein